MVTVFPRTLLNNVGYDNAERRADLKVKRNPVIDDLRVIDMYEAAIRHDIQVADRKGNWVQKFVTADDAQLYATAQFYRYQEVERFLEEHFKNQSAVSKRVTQEKKL